MSKNTRLIVLNNKLMIAMMKLSNMNQPIRLKTKEKLEPKSSPAILQPF